MADPTNLSDLSSEVQQILANVQTQIREDVKANSDFIEPDQFMNTEFAKEAHELLKNWAKVEAESEKIKQKVTHSKPAPVSFLPSGRPKTAKAPLKKPKDDPQDDFALAFGLLQKYKKNRNMIHDEIREENHRLELIEGTDKPIVKAPLVDPVLAIEMRHAKIDMKRKQREKEKVERKSTTIIKENVASNYGGSEAINKFKKAADIPKSKLVDPLFTQQIKEISEKRTALENDSKKIAEEVKKIHEAVRLQAEEYKQLDKARRIKEKELAEKRRIEEEEQRLKKEREEAERKYKEFQMVTFLSKVEQFLIQGKRKAVRAGFSSLMKYNIRLKTICMKVECMLKFRMKSKIVGGWRKMVQEEKLRRETELYLKQKEEEEMKKKLAERHYEKKRLAIVWKALKAEVIAAKEQKRIQEEHERMQKQIQEFLERMKQEDTKEVEPQSETNQNANIVEVEEEEKYEKEKEEEAAYENETFEPEEKVEETQPLPPISEEVSKESLQSTLSQQSAPEPKENTKESAPKQRQPKPIPKSVIDMEERAKKRKEKREQLKKVYEEKQKAKELERLEMERKKMEEEKKRKVELKEKKRREELLKKQQEEAKKALETKLRRADSHYNKDLLKLSLKGLKRNIADRKECVSKADAKYAKILAKKTLAKWKKAWENTQREQEVFFESRNKLADTLYHKHLLSEFKSTWRKCKLKLEEEKAELFKKHEKWMQLSVLKEWKRAVPILKKENREIQANEDLRVMLIQIKLRGPKVLKTLKENVVCNKEEREKEKHKAELWSKVNSWLEQYDSLKFKK